LEALFRFLTGVISSDNLITISVGEWSPREVGSITLFNEKIMYEELLDPPCWELRGRPDEIVALRGLFDLFDDTYSLILESGSQSDDIKDSLTAISDSAGLSETVVCSSTMTGLRYELVLGRPIPEGLIDICEHHATPEYCDSAFVFHRGRPVLLWFDFGDDQITIRPEVDQRVVEAFAERTGMVLTKREK
jgi:hypothetical protein